MIVVGALVFLAAALLLGGKDSTARLRALVARPEAAHRGGGAPKASGDADEVLAIVAQAASLLRAGASPHHVFRQLARVHRDGALAPVLTGVARAMELGEPGHRAILGQRAIIPESHAATFEALAAAWAVAERTGAPLAEVLDRLAESLRDAEDLERERQAAMAGPAASVRVLVVLPFLGLLLGALIGADLLAVAATPVGAASLLGGVVLLLAGRAWMRALVRIRDPA